MNKLSVIALLFLVPICNSFADGCLPGDPCFEAPAQVAPVEPVKREITPAAKPKEEKCGWGNRIATGVPVWFFQEENTEVGGGLYFDIYPCAYPLNFRLGAEVSHIGADQPNALNSAEFPGKPTRLTFIRIPLAVEYRLSMGERTDFFVGGGPDIIRTANDVSDTSVGLHLSGRILHQFDDHFGVAVEAGYMWGEVNDDGGGDIDLDNAFIIPSLSYTF